MGGNNQSSERAVLGLISWSANDLDRLDLVWSPQINQIASVYKDSASPSD